MNHLEEPKLDHGRKDEENMDLSKTTATPDSPLSVGADVLEARLMDDLQALDASSNLVAVKTKEVLSEMTTDIPAKPTPISQGVLHPVITTQSPSRLDRILNGETAKLTVDSVCKDSLPEVAEKAEVKEESLPKSEILEHVAVSLSVLTLILEKAVSIEDVPVPAASLASTRESSCNSSLGSDNNSNNVAVSSTSSTMTDDEDDDFLTTGQKLVIDCGTSESQNNSFADSNRDTPEAASVKTRKRTLSDSASPSPLPKVKKVDSSTKIKKGSSETRNSEKKTGALEVSSTKKGVRKDGTFEVGCYPIPRLVKDAFLVEGDYKDICSLCMSYKQYDNETLPLRCKGKCNQNYHITCLVNNAHEYPEHTTNFDSDNFVCSECSSGEHFCFGCSSSDTDDNLVRCPDKNCGRFFHFKCLMGTDMPKTEQATSQDSELPSKILLRPCPQHHCGTCKALSRSGKNKEVDKSLVKCILCPAAYHFNFMCFPAEASICPENAHFMICPKHRNEKIIKEQSKGDAKKKSSKGRKSISIKAMNNTVCLSCKTRGELLMCETCPFTSHMDCAGLEFMPPDEQPWHCPDCSKGKLPMMLDIVWYKTGSHRCWPCQILPSNISPENVRHKAPEGTFILRYLGTNEYGFATSSQVLPYEILDPRWVQNPSKTLHFPEGLDEAKKISAELLAQKNMHLARWFEGVRPTYVKIKGNKVVFPARYGARDQKNKEDTFCNCSANVPSPCGPKSGCLNRDMEYECPKACPAGKGCMNQRLRNRMYPKLKVFYTPDRGWALLAQQDVKKGDLVIEYVGEIITTQERDKRICAMRLSNDANFYFLDLTEGRVIDAGPAGNLARFANHSCDANCSSEKWNVDGETRIALIAIKDIKKGQEITFDYRWQYEAGVTSRECLCHTEKCNGTIGGKTYVSKPVLKQGSQKKATVSKKNKPTTKKLPRKSTPRPKSTSKRLISLGQATSETEDAYMNMDIEENSTSSRISPPTVPSETSET